MSRQKDIEVQEGLILELVRAGTSRKQIAKRLGVGIATFERYLMKTPRFTTLYAQAREERRLDRFYANK